MGAVIVKNNRIITTGYNGSLSGQEHCDDIGHLLYDGHCIRVVHAEVNAICQCARLGISCLGATCYCTHLPCLNCYKTMKAAGISYIVYSEKYKGMTPQNVYPAELYKNDVMSLEEIDKLDQMLNAKILMGTMGMPCRRIDENPSD